MLKVLVLNALLYGFAFTAEPEDQKQRKRGILQDGWVGIQNPYTYGHGQPWTGGQTPWKPIQPIYHQEHSLQGRNHNYLPVYQPHIPYGKLSHEKPIIKTFPVYITKHVVLEKPVPVPQPVYIREKVHVPVEVPVPVPQAIPIPVPFPFNPHFPHPHHPEFHGHFYPHSPYGPFDHGYGYGHGHGHGHGHGYGYGYGHGPDHYGHNHDHYGHGHGHGHYSHSHEHKDKHSEH